MMKEKIVALAIFLASFSSHAITGKEFVDCYLQAVKARAAEIKEQHPEINLCDEASAKEKAALYELYSYVNDNGQLSYYGDEAMGEQSVRFHFDRIRWEVECYDSPSNIFSAWIEGAGNAIGVDNHNNLKFNRDALSKVLGRDVYAENGSELFSEHDFEFCQ